MVSAVHLTLTEHSPADVELRYWREDPNDYTSRSLLKSEIADLIAKAESEYYSVSLPDLVSIGTRLYRWLVGSDRWLVRELTASGSSPVALMIEAAGKLAHLPWEVLHDGTTFLVHGANPAVLPVRWRQSKSRSATPAG